MSKYTTVQTFTSKVEGFEDVSYTLRKFSHGLRAKVRTELAAALAKIRQKTEQINELVESSGITEDEEAPAPELQLIIPLDDSPAPVKAKGDRKFTADQLAIIDQIADINREIEVITASDVDPIYLRHGLTSITGLELEGIDKVDWKALYEHGPEDLCQEIIRNIKTMAGLLPEVKENLESPSTSGAAVDGQMNDMNAPAASATDGMPFVTVGDTSLNG